MSRRRTFYLPHLSRSQMDDLSVALFARGYRVTVKGSSLLTDAGEDVISFCTPVRGY
jgi:hypothetical protein